MCDLLHETNEHDLIIVLPHKRITMNGVFFSDKKKNIIMDGTFTKIQYSESFFTMNGIFVYFPVMGKNKYITTPMMKPMLEQF